MIPDGCNPWHLTPLQHVNLILDRMPNLPVNQLTWWPVCATAHGPQHPLPSHQRMGHNGQPHGLPARHTEPSNKLARRGHGSLLRCHGLDQPMAGRHCQSNAIHGRSTTDRGPSLVCTSTAFAQPLGTGNRSGHLACAVADTGQHEPRILDQHQQDALRVAGHHCFRHSSQWTRPLDRRCRERQGPLAGFVRLVQRAMGQRMAMGRLATGHWICLVGTLVLSGLPARAQRLTQARPLSSVCFQRYLQLHPNHHFNQRDSVEALLTSWQEQPLYIGDWPIDRYVDIPFLSSWSAFKLGAFVAQMGLPTDALAWLAMEMDSLEIAGMQGLFRTSRGRNGFKNPNHRLMGFSWSTGSGFTPLISYDSWRMSRQLQWPGHVRLSPDASFVLQADPWTFSRSTHGVLHASWSNHTNTWGAFHGMGQMGWHHQLRNQTFILSHWGDRQGLAGGQLTVLLRGPLLFRLAGERPQVDLPLIDSPWRRTQRPGMDLTIPYWDGDLQLWNRPGRGGIRWQSQGFNLQWQQSEGQQSLSLQKLHPQGSAQIMLGDISGASLAMQRHGLAWGLQSAAGYLSGQSSTMWHGDPMVMRSAGYYLQIGMTHQGAVKGKVVGRLRPSGWSGRLVIQVDLNKAFHSGQKSGKLLLTDDSPVI